MVKGIRNNIVGGNEAQATTRTVIPDQSEIIRLIRRAAGGDFEAFGELYSIYLDRIYRYVFYQVKDKMTAEDITEDVFIKAWRAISSCKGKEKTFSSWLYRIAHNQVIDIFRGQKKEVSTDIESIADSDYSELGVEIELEHQELLNGIAGLPQNQKQVIVLKFIEGLDNRKIGQIMDKNQGAIRILQMRALAKLREKLSSEQ
jgi:RNA polymerase sigma-70 factor (ECF subfamily)